MSKLYSLSSRIYLDRQTKCYKRLITINKEPEGILKNYVKRVKHNKLSPFEYRNPCDENCFKHCYYAILDPNNKYEFLCIENIDDLIDFLVENGYTIDTKISKMLNKNTRINMNNERLFYIRYNE